MCLISGKYYGSDIDGETMSVSVVIRNHLLDMTDIMKSNVTSRTMVDVETVDKVYMVHCRFLFNTSLASKFF